MNADEFRPMTLRMPVALLEQVRARAAEHDRSAGAEVRMIVREHFNRQAEMDWPPRRRPALDANRGPDGSAGAPRQRGRSAGDITARTP